MKYINVFLIVIAFQCYSQRQINKYIQLTCTVYPLGILKWNNIEWYTDTIKNEEYDNYVFIKKALKLNEPIKIINKLAEKEWELVSTIYRPDIQLMTYYFKRELTIDSK